MATVLKPGLIALTEAVEDINYSVESVPLPKPVIDSFSGSVAQGQVVTLSGLFTHKRNGQVLYFTGNPEMDGLAATEFIPINGAALNPDNPNCYKHTADLSFSGSGASIKFIKEAGNIIEGPHNSKVVLLTRSKEVYFTYTSHVVMNDWASQHGGQIKMGRVSTITNTHSSDPVLGHTDLRNGSTSTILYFTTRPAMTKMVHASNGLDAYTEATFGKWTRFEEWTKLPDYPSKNQATVGYWAEALVCETEDKFRLLGAPPETALVTEYPTKNWEYLWKEYTIDKTLIPFYVRSWMDCVVHIDAVYVNDSPERVELGNSPVLHNCTKKVVQEQITRESGNIEFKISLANLSTDDPIYAFVVNSDGQYSDGRLIRSAE